MEPRLLTLILWGGGVVFLFGFVLFRRLRAWGMYRDRAARREALEAVALFITAVAASGSIVAVLAIPEVTSIRSFLVALSLGAFVGVGIIMATEEPRPRRREVRKRDRLSPPHDPAGIH